VNNVASPSPAEKLTGLTLKDGWRVTERLLRPSGATGGHFSVGYKVRNATDQEAFLKALDYSEALKSPDAARALQSLTSAYNFERDLLRRCAERRLSRVVEVLADGSISTGPLPTDTVQYLIFEYAPNDARGVCTGPDGFTAAWAMRAMHHAATGLQQLHGVGVAHQDLKPSNLIVLEDRSSKIADLGSAAVRGGTAPRDQLPVPGDIGYAPPELLYGHMSPDWSTRRLGCDLYLLGSMLVFFVSGIGVTAAVQTRLDPAHRWSGWLGTYAEVLPYVRAGYAEVVDEFRGRAPGFLAEELTIVLRELCEPEVERRGHPAERLGSRNPYSLERYVSRFDVLAKKAELALLRAR
jgi:hypothetical protein